MGGGLNDMNWAVEVKEQREKIQNLEKDILKKPNELNLTVGKITDGLIDYLSIKKGSDDWAQERMIWYQHYMQGKITGKNLIDYLK